MHAISNLVKQLNYVMYIIVRVAHLDRGVVAVLCGNKTFRYHL